MMKQFFLPCSRLVISIFCALFLFTANVQAQDGKALFMQKCASCHAIDKNLTGPALKGIEERVTDKKLLYDWVRNNQKVLASGNKYFNDLYIAWNKTSMNVFAELTDAEIESVLTYVREWKPAEKAATQKSDNNDGESSVSLWIIGILIALFILLFVFINVLSTLKRYADEKQGIEHGPIVPFYRKKRNIILVTLILVSIFAYWLVQATIGLGRNQNYQPEQPIYYSHKVHAGINQINCLYCHTSAKQGKFSGVPPVNVCMNCHMAINEYKGDPIFNEEGKQVNGTAEIQKLYEYAGWDQEARKYTGNGKPIPWIRVHNLPDHVLFNHSHHVVNAKVQCQTCHGQIQEMHEVKQFASLSMGWCVNCHRNTKVQFKENGFYSMYEKYHNDMKAGKIDSVTADMIGANECQKCHY